MKRPLSPFVRKVIQEVPALSEIPLFGQAPSFPWDQFSQALAKKLERGNLKILPKHQEWREVHESKESPALSISLKLSPLSSPIYWSMGRKDLEAFTSWALNSASLKAKITSEVLQEGFYRYLLLEGLDAMASLPPFEHFTLELGEETPLPQESAFCITVEIQCSGKSCWGHLLFSNLFRNE